MTFYYLLTFYYLWQVSDMAGTGRGKQPSRNTPSTGTSKDKRIAGNGGKTPGPKPKGKGK